MEPIPGQEMNPDFTSADSANAVSATIEQEPVPPRYEKEDKPANVWLRSISSLALYLLIG